MGCCGLWLLLVRLNPSYGIRSEAWRWMDGAGRRGRLVGVVSMVDDDDDDDDEPWRAKVGIARGTGCESSSLPLLIMTGPS